jgi:hypothetical protein
VRRSEEDDTVGGDEDGALALIVEAGDIARIIEGLLDEDTAQRMADPDDRALFRILKLDGEGRSVMTPTTDPRR